MVDLLIHSSLKVISPVGLEMGVCEKMRSVGCEEIEDTLFGNLKSAPNFPNAKTEY